jgi:hypothetical protein
MPYGPQRQYVRNNANNKKINLCAFQEVQAASEGAQISRRAPLSRRVRFEAFDGS